MRKRRCKKCGEELETFLVDENQYALTFKRYCPNGCDDPLGGRGAEYYTKRRDLAVT